MPAPQPQFQERRNSSNLDDINPVSNIDLKVRQSQLAGAMANLAIQKCGELPQSEEGIAQWSRTFVARLSEEDFTTLLGFRASHGHTIGNKRMAENVMLGIQVDTFGINRLLREGDQKNLAFQIGVFRVFRDLIREKIVQS